MADIPPLIIQPDEAERETIRELIFEAEAAGRPERAFGIVRDALYDSWALTDSLRETIDALRAAQDAGEALEEG